MWRVYRKMENENWEHLSVLVMNGNGPLFSFLFVLVFSPTLDDISLIRHVLNICGKLPHQTLQAPVCQTMGKSDVSQAGEWQGRNLEWKPTRSSIAKEKRREKKSGSLLNMDSQGWSSISQSGANSCQSEWARAVRDRQRVDKISVEISWLHKWAVITTPKRTRQISCPLLIFLWSWIIFLPHF